MPRKLSPDKLIQRLLQSTAAPIYVLAENRQIVFANAACSAWLGQTLEALVGTVCEYLAPDQSANGSAPNLAPPPEVEAGAALGYVASTTDGGRVRACHFHLLSSGEGEGRFILAVVSGQPVSASEVDQFSGAASESQRLHAQLLELRAEWKKQYKSSAFLGVSPASQRIRSQIGLAAAGARRVLILGPAGSGRDHVARSIHFSQGGAPGPLIPIACRLLDAELMQQTLAAFLKRHPPAKESGQALLLQDVDQLSATAQYELAEFLRLPGVELTVRSTAKRSLQRLAARGRFRADLAHALSTLTIAVPSLSKRPEDLPLLAQHLVEQENCGNSRKFSGFAVDALDQLAAYRWPGNVKELQQVVRESCGRALGPYITPADLPNRLRHDQFVAAHPPRKAEKIDLDKFLADIEREILERALAAAKGNKTRAATWLGIHRARLIRRLVQLGIVEAPTVQDRNEQDDDVVIFEPHPDEA